MLLWFLFAVATVLGVLLVIWPLTRPPPGSSDRPTGLEVLQDQLRELDGEVERGQIEAGEAEGARTEISRRLLSAAQQQEARPPAPDPRSGGARAATLLVAAVSIPALSVALYLMVGSPQLPGKPFRERADIPVEQQQVGQLIARIEKHLLDQPDDVRGWTVVAPVYMRLRRYGDAANAYERILALSGRTAPMLAAYGEALVLGDEGLVRASSYKIFTEALSLDALEPKSQFYLGLAELQDGRPDVAVRRWRALMERLPEDTPWRDALAEQLRQAEARLAPADKDTPARAPALSREQMDAGRSMSPMDRQAMIEGMVERLAKRLEQDGDDIDGWLRLARARVVLGRRAAAGEALARAEKIFARDSEALAKIRSLREQLDMPQG